MRVYAGEMKPRAAGTLVALGLIYGAGAGTALGVAIAGGPGLALGAAMGAGLGVVAGSVLEMWLSSNTPSD